MVQALVTCQLWDPEGGKRFCVEFIGTPRGESQHVSLGFWSKTLTSIAGKHTSQKISWTAWGKMASLTWDIRDPAAGTVKLRKLAPLC